LEEAIFTMFGLWIPLYNILTGWVRNKEIHVYTYFTKRNPLHIILTRQTNALFIYILSNSKGSEVIQD